MRGAEASPPEPKRFMSTMWGSTPRWLEEVEFTHRRNRLGTVEDLRYLMAQSRNAEVVIVLGSASLRHRYRDLVFVALIRARRRTQGIVITDATWEPESRALAARTRLPSRAFGLPIRAFVRLVDGPYVRYCVLSTDELQTFPATWGVPKDRVVFTPFPATMPATTEGTRGDYLFVGGNSLRDHGTVYRALAHLSHPAVVATSAVPPGEARKGLSWGALAPDDYDRKLAGCRAAAVVLNRSVRSAGQQSYLNAMLLEKPVIVTDSPGVRDYVIDGETGVIVPEGDSFALRAAIADVFDASRTRHYEEMGRRARQSVIDRRLDYAGYFDVSLLGVAHNLARDLNKAHPSV